MKANELMIGDLITFKDCLKDGVFTSIKVCELHDYNNDIIVSIDGDEVCDELELDEEIVPIPLTPEILEKNGFSRNGLDISLFDRMEGYDFVCASNLQYIHELQHALRLCGVEKEIVL